MNKNETFINSIINLSDDELRAEIKKRREKLGMSPKLSIIDLHIENDVVNNAPTIIYTDENLEEWVKSEESNGYSRLVKKSDSWYFKAENLKEENARIIKEVTAHIEFGYSLSTQEAERLKDLVSLAHAVGYQSGYKAGSNFDASENTANKSWVKFKTENNL